MQPLRRSGNVAPARLRTPLLPAGTPPPPARRAGQPDRVPPHSSPPRPAPRPPVIQRLLPPASYPLPSRRMAHELLREGSSKWCKSASYRSYGFTPTTPPHWCLNPFDRYSPGKETGPATIWKIHPRRGGGGTTLTHTTVASTHPTTPSTGTVQAKSQVLRQFEKIIKKRDGCRGLSARNY